MKVSWKLLLVAGGVLALALTVLSVLAASYISGIYPAGQLQAMGMLGDTFGLVAALFSGLGFAGVAAALVFDAQKRAEDLGDRRRQRQPFIVPSIGEDFAKIDRANRVRSALELEIQIDVPLRNLTEDPAINLELIASLGEGCPAGEVDVVVPDQPIAPHEVRNGKIAIRFRGGDAEQVLLLLKSGGAPIALRMQCLYSSLSKAGWMSEVVYELGAKHADGKIIESILDEDQRYEISPPDPMEGEIGGEPIFLGATPVPGSWAQVER